VEDLRAWRVRASERALDLARRAARAAHAVKAADVVALDVTTKFPLADIFLIASGSSERQVVAISERIEEELAKVGATAARREGVRQGRWALLDFNDVMVHVMHQEDRAYYDLERLWKDCPAVPLPADVREGDAA
jgi:ribosome-associated protein